MKKLIFSLSVVFLFFASNAKSQNKSIFKLSKSISKQYAFIPMGSFKLDSTTVSCQAFYISKYEISNLQYREFLADLKRNNKIENLKTALIDSTKWRDDLMYFEPYVNLYHTHPAYNNYPVVNISQKAAELYCTWLSEKLNKENPEYNFTVRLPQRIEWLHAASSGFNLSEYSWGGPYLRNAKGILQCNFKNYGAEHIHYDRENGIYTISKKPFNSSEINTISDNAFCTAPVNSYFPSSYGLYNMNGNVSEMTQEGLACGGDWNCTGYDVRNESFYDFTESSPFVGFRPVISAVKK